ncbi:hypothetical protein [Natrinema sp. 1APR25-10V2]|uniref:hypothetical protein n=1 Tax=Natrinema sp. 1APR25-10V2 TaxID=2951081 RepID=UPI002876367B|nr:hypothetical protein [Natrinema sp. 1APR25-10V2]MDS0474159.1 hypothetical protein [Natrinema sp. 1APR25-10V2]
MGIVPLLGIVASLSSASILTGPLLFVAVVFAPAALLVVLWVVMRFFFSSGSAA